MKKVHHAFTLVAFFILLFGLTLFDLLMPDISFSEMENRYLKEKPEMTLTSIFDAKFTQDYEKYVDDQFYAREKWMRLKSKTEQVLLKKENNDIVFGKDGYLFQKVTSLPESYWKNINTIKSFAEKNPSLEVAFALAPNSYTVLEDKIPEGLYNVNQSKELKKSATYLKGEVSFIDLESPLKASYKLSKNPLYFKLDHHWTLFGAYEGYRAIASAFGIEPAPLEEEKLAKVEDFYGTFFSAAKKFDAVGDTLYYKPSLDEGLSVWVGETLKKSLYDLSFLKKKDKYGMFLYNNPPIMTLKSQAPKTNGQKLLVFKDSYANSALPFLGQHFESVEIVDLRYYNGKISALIQEQKPDQVLFLYNFITFSESKELIKILY